MKKIILTLSLLLVFAFANKEAKAQDTFLQGTNMLNIGAGFGQLNNQLLPPLSVAYEHSVASELFDYGSIGVGAQLDTHLFDYPDGVGYSSFIGPRVSWHYEWIDNLDTYVSTAAGLLMKRRPNGNGSDFSYSNSFVPVVNLGARYLFTRHFGVYSEISTAVSFFKVGVTFNI